MTGPKLRKGPAEERARNPALLLIYGREDSTATRSDERRRWEGESLRIPRESIILFYNEYGQGQRERQIMSFVIQS